MLDALAVDLRKHDRAAVAHGRWRSIGRGLTDALPSKQAVGPRPTAGSTTASPAVDVAAGGVVVFVDGLRLDLAHALAGDARKLGGRSTRSRLAPLPTVTPTCEAARLLLFRERSGPARLDAAAARTAVLKPEIEVLRRLMKEKGVQILARRGRRSVRRRGQR